MNYLYIMCGLAFSGKSTLARQIAEHTGSKLIAFDQLWVEKENEGNQLAGEAGWKSVRELAQKEIAEALKTRSVVYDDNNIRREHRDEVKGVANSLGARAIVIYLNTPMGVIRERESANRATGERHEVDPANFQRVLDDLEVPGPGENVLDFTPMTHLEEFLKLLPK